MIAHDKDKCTILQKLIGMSNVLIIIISYLPLSHYVGNEFKHIIT